MYAEIKNRMRECQMKNKRIENRFFLKDIFIPYCLDDFSMQVVKSTSEDFLMNFMQLK